MRDALLMLVPTVLVLLVLTDALGIASGPVGRLLAARSRPRPGQDDDGWLVTHRQVLDLLPAEVRAAFDRPTAAELAELFAVADAEHRRVVLGDRRDPHAGHVLLGYRLYLREGHVGGWLDAADGMGQRHGTSAAAVELATALRRAVA